MALQTVFGKDWTIAKQKQRKKFLIFVPWDEFDPVWSIIVGATKDESSPLNNYLAKAFTTPMTRG